jgi:hypothetical protein
MKKQLILFLVLINVQVFAQQYENFGEMFGIDNAIMGQNIIRGEVGFGMSQMWYQPQGKPIIDYTRYTSIVGLDINPYEHFHMRAQFYFDLEKKEEKPPYLSNVYYQIGWYDWRDRTISFGYENYGANRFKSPITDFATSLKRGFVFASFNYDLLEDRAGLKFDDDSQIRITPFVRYSLEYPDRFGVEKGGNHKVVLGTSARWTIVKKIYVEGAVYYYPDKTSKLPWDPDFTYGLGYFNWEAFKLNISYGNWIANRFPWNDKEMEHNPFDGELKVMFTWSL